MRQPHISAVREARAPSIKQCERMFSSQADESLYAPLTGVTGVLVPTYSSYKVMAILFVDTHIPYSTADCHVRLMAGLVLQADILNQAQVVHV